MRAAITSLTSIVSGVGLAMVALAALPGCKDPLVITCTDNATCIRDGKQGQCDSAPIGARSFCTFDSDSCPSGRQWDATAGDGLAGTCLDNSTGDVDMASGDGGGGGDMAGPGGWTAQTSGVTDWLFTIWGSGPNDVYAGGQISKAILHSTDRGATWRKEAIAMDVSIYAIWGTGADKVFAFGGGALFQREPNATWTMQPFPSDKNINAAWGVGNEIWAVGDSGTVVHYDGTAWTLQTVPVVCQDTLHAAHGWNNQHLIITGYNGVLCESTNGGTTWVGSPPAGMLNQTGIWVSGASAFIVADNSTIYRSEDLATGWKTMVVPTTSDLSAILGNSLMDIYAVGGNPHSLILHWNGSVWTEQMSPIDWGLNAIWATGPNDYYVVGMNGTILHGP